MSNSTFYKGCTVSMIFETDDKIIVGHVLEIDDIISFHGESVAQFEPNFHAAIKDYLASSACLRDKALTASDTGRPPRKLTWRQHCTARFQRSSFPVP